MSTLARLYRRFVTDRIVYGYVVWPLMLLGVARAVQSALQGDLGEVVIALAATAVIAALTIRGRRRKAARKRRTEPSS